jgi:hypothetical protein
MRNEKKKSQGGSAKWKKKPNCNFINPIPIFKIHPKAKTP